MNTEFIKGVIVPIITTIDEDEKIDEAKMRAQVDYVIDGGLQGILAFGSNGEFYQSKKMRWNGDFRSLLIRQQEEFRFTLESVQSIRKNVSVWLRWQSKMVQREYRFYSRCS